MNYITGRACSLAKYLIKQGLDPMDAIAITINKYIHNPKLDIKKLVSKVKKDIRADFYFPDDVEEILKED